MVVSEPDTMRRVCSHSQNHNKFWYNMGYFLMGRWVVICIFDCVTVPDVGLIRATFDGMEGLSDYDATLKGLEIYREQNATSFLPLPYHRVVALSGVVADEFGRFVKVGDFGNGSCEEEDIIRHFFEYVERKNPRLVSFNGRGFDIPMLLIRALRYNLSFHAYFEQNDPIQNKSKWENYRQRYAEHFHTDLLDSLGGFGAVRSLRLDTLCVMSGLPRNNDVSSEELLELYYQGEQEKINEYCQSETLCTYWLYLKYELLKGDITQDDYYSYLQTMAESLPNWDYKKVFLESIEKELNKSDN